MENIKRKVGRQRTATMYNMDICNNIKFTKDFYEMPIIKNDNFIPQKLVGFNYATTQRAKADYNTGVHFYLDDFLFQRIWNKPDLYVSILKKYGCVLSPDFSLYTDMKTPQQIYNTFRSRLIGAYLQSQGIKVIPTISWSGVDSFDYCFLGIPKGSTVSISTIGINRNKYRYLLWSNGVTEMIKRINPQAILIYGNKIEYDFKGINAFYYQNEMVERFNNLK